MMYDVVVYFSSLQKQTPGRKIDTLEAFATGASSTGANVLIERDYIFRPAKLAVILGWPSPVMTSSDNSPSLAGRPWGAASEKTSNSAINSDSITCKPLPSMVPNPQAPTSVAPLWSMSRAPHADSILDRTSGIEPPGPPATIIFRIEQEGRSIPCLAATVIRCRA